MSAITTISRRKSAGLAIALTTIFLIFILTLAPAPFGTQAATVQPELLALAVDQPDTAVRVIIQQNSTETNLKETIAALGGNVVQELQFIKAFAAELPAKAVLDLANMASVNWVSLDMPFMSGNIDSTVTLRDEFNTSSHSNNDGSVNWASNWIETNDDGDPNDGDIEIDDGLLMIKDDNRSIHRSANLNNAATAILSFDYRRYSFDSSSDYVAIQLSTDGGTNWIELDHFAGPASDSNMQTVSYDIAEFVPNNIIIRFITSTSLSSYDRLYIDNLQIEYEVDASAINENERVTAGLQALYTFKEGSGSTIYDISGAGSPLDLTIENDNFAWYDGYLSLTGANRAFNGQNDNKIYQACTNSNEISLEVWVTPTNDTQDGPARIVTLSNGSSYRNFTLAQDGNTFVARLRTTTNGVNGINQVVSGGIVESTTTHLLFTRTVDGIAKLYINGELVDTETIGGDFSNWDSTFDFGLGNEFNTTSSNIDRDWQGEYHLTAVYCQALTAEQVAQNYQAGDWMEEGVSNSPTPTQITDGLQALYNFNEGSTTTIQDSSGVGSPLDLTIENNNFVWHDGYLSLTGANRASNGQNDNKIYQACTNSNEISLEAWVTPANDTQGGPARIVTLSEDGYARNFTLAQDGNTFVVRLRTTTNGLNGMNQVVSGSSVDTTTTHLLFTRSNDGTAKLYVNGQLVDNETIGGDFSNWDSTFDFGLGNEFTADSTSTDRDWQGEYHLVAVYCQALTAEQVALNYQAGENANDSTLNHYLNTLNVQPVWDMGLQGQDVTVAVIDSGISPSLDFGDRLIAQVSFNEDAQTLNDNFGHGTHIAGIIGGNGTSSNGLYQGIAPQANLIGLKVSDEQGMAYESDTVAALQWVFENKDLYNIRVVNLSLNSTEEQTYHTSPLDLASELLWFNGVVVVASAGNRSFDGNFYTITASPANDPFIITVGASTEADSDDIDDDDIALFSAHGTTVDGFVKPDIIAPGYNIVSVLSDDSDWEIEYPDRLEDDGDYFRLSGTSMAAPIVSGAAALLLQAEPDLTPDQVKYRLMNTGNTITPVWFDAIFDQTVYPYLEIYSAVTTPTTESANQDTMPHMALAQMALIAYWSNQNGADTIDWSTIDWSAVNWDNVDWDAVDWDAVDWSSVNWGSVNWGSVNWGSVNWGSVNWGSVNWGSVNWGSVNWGSVNWGSVNWGSVNWGSVNWDD